MSFMPINFKNWIEENRHLLKPPVGNKAIWENREFMVTVVGGPNNRADFHINQGEEFFYQLEGDINLKIVDPEHPGNGDQPARFKDLPIREGEIYLLPPNVPHSPQRPANTVGLVLERKRRPGENDGFAWFCKGCHRKLYEESLYVTSIVTDLPPVFERFYGNPSLTLCRHCGTQHVKGERA